jgi:hypothetical protein
MKSAPLILPEKPPELKTPLYKKRDRPLHMNVEKVLDRGAKNKVLNELLPPSLSPVSPLKSSATITHHASNMTHLVGRNARTVHDAAKSRVHKKRAYPKHLCTHFTKCNEGRCQTCKCAKCLLCQPSGKRASALRP